MKTVKTPAGIFTINKVKIPSAYTCAAEQKIEYISENHVQIITMNQAVSFGDQILSPRICQSCMNPEKITIYPLEIEYFGEKVFFTDHYRVKEWKKCEKILTAFPILCYNKNAEGCSRNLLKRCFFLGLV